MNVNSCRCQKDIAKSCAAKLLIGLLQNVSALDIEHLPDQRKAVGMNTAGGNADQHVARLDVLSGDHFLLLHNAHREACKIIFLIRHNPGMLCRLTAKERAVCLHAALCNALYNGRNFLRNVLSACNIIQEKQGISACTRNVIDAHGNAVNSYGIMTIHQKCQLLLGSDSIGSGEQNRIFHLADL